MNSLSSSYSNPIRPRTISRRQKTPYRYDAQSSSPLFFAPLLQGLLLTSIVLSILLVMLFCTHPMTGQTIMSDFWAGVEGVQMIFL